MIKRLTLTPDLLDVWQFYQRAEARYQPGYMSAALIEIPKLALADAVIDAIREQTETARIRKLLRVPKAKPVQVPVVELELRRRKPRRSA